MSWSIVSGFWERSFDHSLLDEGNRRFRKYAHDGADRTLSQPEIAESASVLTLAFVATHRPQCVACIVLEGVGSLLALAASGDSVAGLLNSGPVTNLGAEQVRGLWSLLVPTWLTKVGIQPPIPQTFTVPGDRLADDPWIAPAFTHPGVDQYVATFDQTLGIITAWEAHIDGAVARRDSLRSLHLHGPLRKPPHGGKAVR